MAEAEDEEEEVEEWEGDQNVEQEGEDGLT